MPRSTSVYVCSLNVSYLGLYPIRIASFTQEQESTAQQSLQSKSARDVPTVYILSLSRLRLHHTAYQPNIQVTTTLPDSHNIIPTLLFIQNGYNRKDTDRQCRTFGRRITICLTAEPSTTESTLYINLVSILACQHSNLYRQSPIYLALTTRK